MAPENELKIPQPSLSDEIVAVPALSIEGKVKIQAEIGTEFSYADYHADGLWRAGKDLAITPYSLIRELRVENHTGETLPGLAIHFSFDHEAFSIDPIVLPPLPSPSGKIRLPWLKVMKARLDDLVNAIPCTVRISLLSTKDGNILDMVERQFAVLPISQPSSHLYEGYRLLAKYVTPLAPRVKQLTNLAVVYHGGQPIIAYQNFSYDDMAKEIKAIYEAIHDENILYQNPPAGESKIQRLRLPEEVLRDKKGTCIDLSLLFASALEEVGYHSCVIRIDGHAFVGVFLQEKDHFDGGITDKVADVTRRSGSQDQRMLLIETTLACSSSTSSFQDALDKGKENLRLYEGQLFQAVDVSWCHHGGIYGPLPVGGQDIELENVVEQKEIRDRDLSPIVANEFNEIESSFRMDRFKTWERKLLDLSETNRLVKFVADQKNSMRILGPNVIATLAASDSVTLVLSSDTQAEVASSFFRLEDGAFAQYYEHLGGNELLAYGLEPTLKSLLKKAKSAWEETGASPLYLSLGLLTFTSPKSGQRIHAPFLLLPVTLKREPSGKRYSMSYDLGDLKVNETFFEYYKIAHPEIDFSRFYDFDDLAHYEDLAHSFRAYCEEDIVLEEGYAFLSNLSFAHQVMWLDIVKRKDELSENPVIRSIVDNQSHLTDALLSDDSPVEGEERYEDFAAPLYYDSSQLRAIIDAGEGRSFILDGPPGTGKSQTIVNMIANAFYHGRKVLFVAEKKAALDVVADRMGRLGLGQYCLELHSSKATKGDFFGKLAATMELGPTKAPEEYENKCLALTIEKNALRDKINAMHDTKRAPLSLYDCIVESKRLRYLLPHKVYLPADFVSGCDQTKLKRCRDLIDTYVSLTHGIRHFDGSPIRYFGVTGLNFLTDRDRVKADLTQASETTKRYHKAIVSFFGKLPLPEVNLSLLPQVLKVFDLAFGEEIIPGLLNELTRHDVDFKPLFAKMTDLAALRVQYEDRYDIDGLLEHVNLPQMASLLRDNTGFFSKKKAQKTVKAALEPYVKLPLRVENLGNVILQAEAYAKKKDELLQAGKQWKDITGIDVYENLTASKRLADRVEATKEYLALVLGLATEGNRREVLAYFLQAALTQDPIAHYDYDAFLEYRQEFEATKEMLVTQYGFRFSCLPQGEADFPALVAALEYGADPSHYGDLAAMSRLNALEAGFAQEGIAGFLPPLYKGDIRSEELPDLFTLSLSYACLTHYFGSADVNDFSAAFLNDRIEAYKKAIHDYSQTTVEAIAARISASFARNEVSYASSGAIGRLKKAVASNGRGVSIRGTLSEYSDLILQYFPCFLMSPLSAAQYLSVDAKSGKAFSKFDLVIFDEASQIPVHEAIGPIARGNSLIVAGDPKQMPPSPYFSAGLALSETEEDDDATKFQDSPSLLDECLAISLPRHRLRYHYRSKHESLIEFSNRNFYHGDLYTFPSAKAGASSIDFTLVRPKVAKADSSLSNEELQALLTSFKTIYQSPETKTKSVGLICFNIKQADRISDAITRLLEQDRGLAAVVEEAERKTGEPWFVKSIENVQGDERDIIILSIGFPVSKAGYAVVRGPLVAGDNNGGRRLNVAASRAKEKMIVISTIGVADFPSDDAIKNPGVQCLKDFLRFAEHAAEPNKTKAFVDESSLLYYLREDLQKRGHKVAVQVGTSSFRVDLAILSPDGKDYDLGILVDTDEIPEEVSYRDQVYVREAVLNAMKWKIVSVYALEYFKDPEGTIARIEEALAKDYAPTKEKIEAKIVSQEGLTSEEVYGAEPYPEMDLDPLSYDNEYGYDPSLPKYLEDVIARYSPISYFSLKKCVAYSCGFKTFNGLREKRLLQVLNRLFFENRAFDQTQYFYWSSSSRNVTSFRLAGEREVEDIAKEEIACAMARVLAVQGNLSQDDLYHVLMQVFGFASKTLTRPYRERFDVAYAYGKEKGLF